MDVFIESLPGADDATDSAVRVHPPDERRPMRSSGAGLSGCFLRRRNALRNLLLQGFEFLPSFRHIANERDGAAYLSRR
jgi:hypothetical protein